MEPQRYPISIRLIGVMHKEKNKMYMTSVLWSDESDIVVYRSFRDFKKIHKQMKKAFPPANPLKRSDRVIPKFGDKKTKRRGQKKGPSKSVLRLKFLEKYCNDLLSCDPRVSQSADLIRFFRPTDQDLLPEFAKNSIMVMPSDDVDVGHESTKTNVGNVTQPFVTETYRCVAPYETKDTKNKPFKVAEDEKVDVLIKDKAGWWMVENEDKQLAWFPAPYLEKLDDEDVDSEDDTSGFGVLYTAVKNYKAGKGDEVSMDIGSVVEVLQKSDNGWWLIRSKGKGGYVPAIYLQPYNHPRVRMAALKQDLRSSSLNLSQLQIQGSGMEQPHKLTHSQGNLLQLPSLPNQLRPADKHKSHSLDVLSGPRLEQLPASVLYPRASIDAGAPVSRRAAPVIMVEMDSEGDGSETWESDGSLQSQSSEFSLTSSSGSSFLNLSPSSNVEQLRLSRTPPPMVYDRLDVIPVPKMTPSVSDPNLFQMPSTPKVPPRPRAQEILTRCTTITRKNASMGGQSPVMLEIQAR